MHAKCLNCMYTSAAGANPRCVDQGLCSAPRHGPAGYSAGTWNTHGGVSYVSYAPVFVWVPQQFPMQEAMGSRAHESHDRGATFAMNAHEERC